MPNSGHGGSPGTRVMIIFVFCVNPQTPNIENFDVYRGLQIPGGISSFFSSNFPSNAVAIMSGDPFLTQVMTIFIKTYIFVKVREGRKKGTDKRNSHGMSCNGFKRYPSGRTKGNGLRYRNGIVSMRRSYEVD